MGTAAKARQANRDKGKGIEQMNEGKAHLVAKFILYLIANWRIIKRLTFCKVGRHDWKTISGREGSPKAVCSRCFIPSKERWSLMSKEMKEEIKKEREKHE